MRRVEARRSPAITPLAAVVSSPWTTGDSSAVRLSHFCSFSQDRRSLNPPVLPGAAQTDHHHLHLPPPSLQHSTSSKKCRGCFCREELVIGARRSYGLVCQSRVKGTRHRVPARSSARGHCSRCCCCSLNLLFFFFLSFCCYFCLFLVDRDERLSPYGAHSAALLPLAVRSRSPVTSRRKTDA